MYFLLFCHKINFTPFTTKYKNKIIIINRKICGNTYAIDGSNKILLVQR